MKFAGKNQQAVRRMSAEDPTSKISGVLTAGLIFLMLLYLSLTIYSSTKLAEYTEFISSHPFEVVISAGDIKTHLSEMRIRAERLTKYNSKTDIELVKAALSSLNETIEEPLETIKARYLGDPDDVQELKETLKMLDEEMEACLLFAETADLEAIESYEEIRLYPLYEKAAESVRRIVSTAQERKLWYGETAEIIRKNTLTGSLVLMALMVGVLLLQQHILQRQRRELLVRSLLFDNLSQSIDDAFLISDAGSGEIYYTALNVERILGHTISRQEEMFLGFLPEDVDEMRTAMENPDYPFPFIKEVKYSFPGRSDG